MSLVATLISNPQTPSLDEATLARMRALLPSPAEPVWLDAGVAADILFQPNGDDDHRRIAAHIRDALGGAPLDVVVQPIAGRRKRLFLADMDSTMIGQECIDELADKVGLRPMVAAITERAMRGEIAFDPALRERVALLKGLPVSVIDDLIAERITLTPGGRVLVATMRKHGAYTCLVSGGFTLFTNRVAAMIGFDENRANRLGVAADRTLSGLVEEPIFGREDKLNALREIAGQHGITPQEAIAAGDGANDISMLEAAGMGVAFHAKPAVKAIAAAQIDHGDLTALLYVQGYRRDEFATVP